MPPVKERALSNFFSPSQNHLILIVGLVALSCVICGLALAFGAQTLDTGQRWVLILFLLLFPAFGLGTSLWLILRHHRKLTVAEADDEVKWDLSDPAAQRNKLNAEVIELASTLGIPKQQISDLRSAYIVAQDLALREIQNRSQTPILRHVNIGDAGFEGLLITDDIVYCIDVIFLVSAEISQDKTDAILRKTSYAEKAVQKIRPGTKIRLLLAVVTQIDKNDEALVRSLLTDSLSQGTVEVDIDFMDFEGLQRIYAAD